MARGPLRDRELGRAGFQSPKLLNIFFGLSVSNIQLFFFFFNHIHFKNSLVVYSFLSTLHMLYATWS